MRHPYDINPYRSKRQLLEELRVAASRASEDGDISHMTLTFAVLLVKVSDEVYVTTRNIIWLKRLVFILVILLAIMVLPPVIKELYEFISENSFTWAGPKLPDLSRIGDWLKDLGTQLSDWFRDLWKDDQ